jgi:hypothetical protein
LTGQCKFDGNLFCFFLLPAKEERNPTHIAHIGKPHEPTLKSKLAKECNLANAHAAKLKHYLYF